MASMMPNPIAQRLRLLFNAAHPNASAAPVGGGGGLAERYAAQHNPAHLAEEMAAQMGPAHLAEKLAGQMGPAHPVEQVAGGLGGDGNAGGGVSHAMLVAALAGLHHGGDHPGGGLAERYAAQHNPAHLAEEMAAQMGPAHLAEKLAGQMGHTPAPPQPGIHYFGPGGSGIAYPQPGEGGPIGSRGIAYSSPPRHRSALALAFGRAPMQAAVHPFQAV